NYFMYRDFQARNVMLTQDSEPCFIDFQGGRKGPFYYDLASFLWQASAQYNDELRAHLIEVYYQELKKWVAIGSFEEFKSNLNLFVLFRTLQVLGAYGFRGYIEEKSYFVRSIPFAINNLKALLLHEDLFKPYAYLKEVLEKLVSLPQFENKSKADATSSSCKSTENQEVSNNKKLKVLVYSFSYHRGIPKDLSGNGGGYVFDCRAVHNPGRYAQYKKLTGRDAEVIQFLEDDGEITEFLSHVYGLVDMHVARYIERGFTNLMFSFGCTGGQHRSVYSAQHVAEYISNKFGCEVQLIHREQHIEEYYEAK
uniref:RapZ C-terminal domain-containing protein n=1 Tax=Hoylesella nanceiensis TaxID=425941 RepID=UPI00242AC808